MRLKRFFLIATCLSLILMMPTTASTGPEALIAEKHDAIFCDVDGNALSCQSVTDGFAQEDDLADLVLWATFYEHIYFGGASYSVYSNAECPSFRVGFPSITDATGDRWWNDRVSSASPAACDSIAMFEHDGFEGSSILCRGCTSVNYCGDLTQRGFNDILSSFDLWNDPVESAAYNLNLVLEGQFD